MNKLAIAIGVVLILISAWFIYVMVTVPDEPETTTYNDETFIFVDSTGQEMEVQYDQSTEFAKVTYADNEYELTRAVSGSGTKYQSDNGLVVFSEHQGEARLEVGGEVVALGVLETDDSVPETTMDDVADLSPVVADPIEVVDVPVLGQRCIDSATVDCAALEAAASAI